MRFKEYSALFVFALMLSGQGAIAGELEFQNAGDLKKPVQVGKLPKIINESSGLIKSRRHADRGVFWTHNDSGDTARIFAIDATGKLLRTVDIPGAENIDWEEITMDEQGRLIVCDCGDNSRDNNRGRRMGVVLYRFAESDAFDKNEKIEKVERFQFHYPEGKKIHDAEGAFARAGAVYLFSKEVDGAKCYKLPMPEKAPAESVEMQRVAKTTSFSVVTGASLTPDGKHLALINYLSVVVIDFPEAFEKLAPNAKGELPIFTSPRRSVNCFLGQTEGVAWDGDDLLLTTEGRGVFRLTK